MKSNKKRQTIKIHFRYNKRKKKIYDTAVSPKPSTLHRAKLVFDHQIIKIIVCNLLYEHARVNS